MILSPWRQFILSPVTPTIVKLAAGVGGRLRPPRRPASRWGLVSFRGDGPASARATLDRTVRGGEHTRAFYLSALRRLMYESSPVRANEYEGGGRAEIDHAADPESVRRRRLSG